MIELPIPPLPPCWEAAVGWTGGDSARWMSGFWTSLGDHPHLSDGRTSMSGDGRGWLAWSRHAKVAPHLWPYDLGSSEMEGPHALLFDRGERRVYAASRDEAERLVRGQWPSCEEPELAAEQIEAVTRHMEAAMASWPLPTASEIIRRMREHSRLVAEMVTWLDQLKEEER